MENKLAPEFWAALETQFSSALEMSEENRAAQTVVSNLEEFLPLMAFLRDHPAAWFDHLSSISAVDWGTKLEPRFELVYHLFSYPLESAFCVRIFAEVVENSFVVPSLSELWPTAEWHEREIWDLFGIAFAAHPDLRRIFMPEDWQGHPLRKDYQNPKSYHGIQVEYYT